MSARLQHTCAVCPKPIASGFLMCLPHWKLVPHEQQQLVYRTYGRWTRCAEPRLQSGIRLRADYFAARDAAIASAQAALGVPTTTTGESS